VSRGGVLLFIIVRICAVYTDNFWTLCIAWYSEEKVLFSVLKWKLEGANVRHLTSSGDGNISVCGTPFYVQNTKNCMMSINTIIFILIYHYHNALELINFHTFRLIVLQRSHECRHHLWHWQYVYIMFRILYVACLTFYIVSCYIWCVCIYNAVQCAECRDFIKYIKISSLNTALSQFNAYIGSLSSRLYIRTTLMDDMF
jgi:hypothetical protein